MTDSKHNSIDQPHPSFTWNGQTLKKKELLLLAEEYTETGTPHLKTIGDFFKNWFDGKPKIEVQTSGSTGKPKTIKVKKEQMVNSALATGNFFNLPEETTALLCMPATYIAGKLMIVRALVLGWKIDSIKPQANPLKSGTAYDFCAMTPYQLNNSLDNLHVIEKLIVGGGAVPQHLRRLAQNVPTQIHETYGMTETLTHIAARRVNAKNGNTEIPPFEVLKAVKIWKDERGCLVIDAPNVSDNIVRTNDIVELQSKTKFRLKGRLDNVINSGGIKIHPEEVEHKLQPLITSRFFIAGLPDEALGEKLVLFIEAPFSEEDSDNLNAEIAGLKDLGPYEKPKALYFVEHFVETHTGKVSRKKTIQAEFD